MSTEANKAIFRRVIEEIWNQGNVELFDQLFAPNFVNHSPVAGVTTDLAGLKHAEKILRAAFSDLHATIEHIVGEGDSVAAYMIMHGLHRGEFMGVPPTGRRVAAAMHSILRIVDGRVVERWGISDDLGMLEQLGALAPSGLPQAA